MTKSAVFFLAVGAFVAISATGEAAELQAYTQAAFEEAQAAGKPVALVFHAVWCGTCRAQSARLREIAGEEAFKTVVFLKVDFDKEEALKKSLSVRSQSTLIVFKGKEERGRGIAVVDRDELRALIRKAL